MSEIDSNKREWPRIMYGVDGNFCLVLWCSCRRYIAGSSMAVVDVFCILRSRSLVYSSVLHACMPRPQLRQPS